MSECTSNLSQKSFPITLAVILNFCMKKRKKFVSETERARAISAKFFTHRVSAYSTATFRRNRFPATFVAILNFCIKHVYLGNREIERFWQNFWSPGYVQSLLASFRQNRLLATFGGYFEFLHKMQRRVYLRNGTS